MTKKTIIFDTDDESKGHYPSDEAYAPLEIGKVYNVTEDITNKNVILSPVDENSDLTTMELGIDGLNIIKTGKDFDSVFQITTIINGNKHKTSITENGDIRGNMWLNDGGGGSLYNYVQHKISTEIESLVKGNPSSGWTRLGNGLLLQWGTIASQNNSSVGTITFPTVFTTDYSFVAQTYGAVDGAHGAIVSPFADDMNLRTSKKIKCFQIQTGQVIEAPAWYVKWMAIGY